MAYFKKGRENNFREREPRGSSRRDSPRSFDRRDSGRSFDRDSEFRENRFERGNRFERARPGRGSLEMHDVICAKCGRECQVPFKPTSSKPVYCRECFGKDDSRPRRESSGMTTEQFDKINEKLNKIMEALKID